MNVVHYYLSVCHKCSRFLECDFALADLEKEVESLKQQQSKSGDGNPDDAALFQVCV